MSGAALHRANLHQEAVSTSVPDVDTGLPVARVDAGAASDPAIQWRTLRAWVAMLGTPGASFVGYGWSRKNQALRSSELLR